MTGNDSIAGRELKKFLSLPEKAQVLIFECLEEQAMCRGSCALEVFSIIDWAGVDCESPIEKIFNIAYLIFIHFYVGNDAFKYELHQQEEIVCGGKTYRADFLFSTEYNESFEYKKDYRLVIECDGHEFHEKTKEQVKKDNERDYDLKSNGYDVLHFSGSQIYNDPLGCAIKVCKYIKKNIGEIR